MKLFNWLQFRQPVENEELTPRVEYRLTSVNNVTFLNRKLYAMGNLTEIVIKYKN